MRFQTTKIIQREDPQIVLHALELSLRQLSLDVVIDGSEIILHGLGPSPRTINPRDAAILRVDTEENRTVINADVTFQPSCLLGKCPQVEAVNYKLDRAFDQMSTEIALAQRRKAQPTLPTATLPTLSHSEEPASSLLSDKTLPESPSVAHNVSQGAFSKQESNRTSSEHVAASPLPNVDQPRPLEYRSMRWRAFWVAATCVIVLLFSYVVLRNRAQPGTVGNLNNNSDQLPIKQRNKLSPMASPAESVTDPREWLGSWVAAMRTRDPVAQASFYADQVDNYLGQKNISNARIVAKKKTALEHRAGLWTIKLEELVLVKESATSVKVNLIKHSIARTQSAGISEHFVRCHLHLRRLGGSWRIISEEDFL